VATITPFAAIRFDTQKIEGSLEDVTAPPYDVISLEEQDQLHKKSPHNIVRLILNREYDGDGPSDNKYTRSAKKLNEFLKEGVLVEDLQDAYYIYEQTFTVKGSSGEKRYTRRGVLAAMKLEPFGEGCVYPHEETFPSHKADRHNLMKTCRANLSSVFGLVPDTDEAIFKLLADETKDRKPDMVVKEEGGVENRLWIVPDETFCASLTKVFEGRKVFIADGHHRYETACTYRDERWKNDSTPGLKRRRGYDYVLITCVPMSDPGLHILPTHRQIVNLPNFSKQEFLNRSSELFEQKPATDEGLLALAEAVDGPIRFGVVFGDGEKLEFIAKPEAAERLNQVAADKTDSWRGLDVAVLHELLLKGTLGLGTDRVPRTNGIHFTKDAREVLEKMPNSKQHSVGFIMRPTRIDQVCAVSETGERMPQKSTYFYPKLLSGLVMRRL